MQQRYRRVGEPREARPGVTRVLARGLGPCCSSRLRTWPVIGLVAFLTQCQVSGDAMRPCMKRYSPQWGSPNSGILSARLRKRHLLPQDQRDVRVASDSPHTGILWRQHGSRGERASIKWRQVTNQRELSNEHGGQVHNVMRGGAPEVLEMQHGEWPL